jgi:phytoene desaturase
LARVVVVGAGLGGLAAAVRLAHAGHAVTVCEQAPTVGGKLGWFERDGFGFDTGPSLVTLPALYRDLFAGTGTPLEDHVDLQALEVACRYVFADGTGLDVPGGPVALVGRAIDDALGAGTGRQWLDLLRRGEDIWQVTRGPFLGSPLQGARTLVRQAVRTGDLRTIAPWLSLRQLGSEYLQHPHLRTLLDRYATYTGSDPRRAPAALATVPYVEQAFGSWYVRGGLRHLGLALAERAELLGCTVRTGADVARVVVEGGRASGVVLAGGERLPADVVVANADAAHLYRDLVPPSAGAPLRRARRGLARVTPSLSGFVLMLALHGRTPGLTHHTVLFGDDYDAEFDAVFGAGRWKGAPRPVADPTVYVSVPDDPATRPDDGHEAWFVLVNAPRHTPENLRAGVDWDAVEADGTPLAQRYADRVLDVMARRGLDVSERLLWLEVRTPADLERATRSVGGSIYGTSSNGVRAAFVRPANASPVPGLYLVGGSSHPGGGLPLVAMSAQIVADLVGPA